MRRTTARYAVGLLDRREGKDMGRSVTAVMLAGRIRPSPLRDALNVHALCMPVGARGTLLDAWLETLGLVPGMDEILVVVNTTEEANSVNSVAGERSKRHGSGPRVRIIAEPAAWRGAAGILRDVTDHLPDDSIVIVCEAKRLPPHSLQPLMDAWTSIGDLSGVVGVCGDENEPAGVSAFARAALELIPRVGYFDMKEQFLPAVCREGGKVVTARICDVVRGLTDLDSYLNTARRSLENGWGNGSLIRASDKASISGSAILDGFCIIEDAAVIEDGAVVHDSVVLRGATVGGGAVVSRSIVGPLASVEPRSRVIRDVVALPAGQSDDKPPVLRWSRAGERSSW